MDKNLPTPYSKIAKCEGECVRLREKPRKKRHLLFKLAFLFLFSVSIFHCIRYFDKISEFFLSFKPSSGSVTEESSTIDVENNEDASDKKSSITNAVRKSEFINDGKIDFSKIADTFSPKSLNSIYEQYGNDAPIVLIIHSMPNEAYSDGITYNFGDPLYSTENNVALLGDRLAELLNQHGINTLHINAFPSSDLIYGSKSKIRELISETVSRNPSIEYVIDISRGVYVNEDFTLSKYTFEKDDITYAGIDIILGFGDTLEKAEEGSYILASLLSSKIESSSLTVSDLEITSCLTPYSLKIDIGSYGNSYEEAYHSIDIVADALSGLIKEKVE